MKLQDVIKQYRKENKISMQEFADRADLSKGYVSMLESGKHPQTNRAIKPSLETYQKVASAMRLSVDDLLRMVDGDERVEIGGSELRERFLKAFDQLDPALQEVLAAQAEAALAAQKARDTHPEHE